MEESGPFGSWNLEFSCLHEAGKRTSANTRLNEAGETNRNFHDGNGMVASAVGMAQCGCAVLCAEWLAFPTADR